MCQLTQRYMGWSSAGINPYNLNFKNLLVPVGVCLDEGTEMHNFYAE